MKMPCHFLTALVVLAVCCTTVTASPEMAEAYEQAGVLCTAAIADNLPVPFCWKDADFGMIPTECEEGYFHEGAMCYKDCADGYKSVLGGTCWEDCETKYLGMACKEEEGGSHMRKSYINRPYTHFTDVAVCPEGMYKGGALCYRDCAGVGLDNCGIGACSYSKSACGKEITSMTIRTAKAVASGATFFASLGGSYTAKALTTLTAKLVKNSASVSLSVFDAALKFAREHFQKPEYKENLYKNIVEVAKNEMSVESFELVGEKGVEIMCRFAVDKWEDAANKEPVLPKSIGAAWQSVKDASGYYDCANLNNEEDGENTDNEKLACARAAISAASNFDPTGILTVASIFMRPRCAV